MYDLFVLLYYVARKLEWSMYEKGQGKNLKGNEIVALPIVTDSGTVLIHADVELKPELINRVIRLGIKTLL